MVWCRVVQCYAVRHSPPSPPSLSQNIDVVSGYLSIISVLVALPMVLVLLTQQVRLEFPRSLLQWLMLSEVVFSVVHTFCIFVAHDPLISALHKFFRLQTKVWVACLAVNLALYHFTDERRARAWTRKYHIAAWLLPVTVTLPLLWNTQTPKHVLPCILGAGVSQVLCCSTPLLSITALGRPRWLTFSHTTHCNDCTEQYNTAWDGTGAVWDCTRAVCVCACVCV